MSVIEILDKLAALAKNSESRARQLRCGATRLEKTAEDARELGREIKAEANRWLDRIKAAEKGKRRK